MKLIDALKHKGNPYEIPDCSRKDLPALFKELGFKKGAEVGVQFGYNLRRYLDEGFEMIGVDPYIHRAEKAIGKYPNCTKIAKTSLEAEKDVPKRSLDFVYIDANHSFGNTAIDMEVWITKVRRGGIMAVHDYHYVMPLNWANRQVKYAVEGFMKAYEVTNWYVIGEKEPDGDTTNDEILSCMFIKHW